MKQTILQFTFSTFTMFLVFATNAQVTIDHTNFIRPAVYTDTVYFSQQSTLPAPSEGADQVWDYSTLVEDSFNETPHFDGSNDPEIPGATGIYPSNLFFQFFLITNESYETVDEGGWHLKGRKSEESIEDISFVTGSGGDILKFPASTKIYNERIDWVKFPMNYEDEWTSTRTDTFNFELTVAGFGLDSVPGERRRYITDTRNVVGWGELILPRADGTPTAPMDVLLIRSHIINVDSFFVGGAPASPALTNAFLLEQGGMVEGGAYFFYKPGFGSSVLFQGIGSDGFFQYRPQGEYNNLTSTKTFDFVQLEAFPNPVSSGQILTIQTTEIVSPGQLDFYDVSGKFLSSSRYNIRSDYGIEVQIPTELNAGFYTYQMRKDKVDGRIGVGKVIVR